MPTTKIRKKTPMKNRPCLWRKMSEKSYDGTTEIRVGRRLKRAMMQANISISMLPIHHSLFKKAGISTPVLDKQMGLYHNKETIINGELNAA